MAARAEQHDFGAEGREGGKIIGGQCVEPRCPAGDDALRGDDQVYVVAHMVDGDETLTVASEQVDVGRDVEVEFHRIVCFATIRSSWE